MRPEIKCDSLCPVSTRPRAGIRVPSLQGVSLVWPWAHQRLCLLLFLYCLAKDLDAAPLPKPRSPHLSSHVDDSGKLGKVSES